MVDDAAQSVTPLEEVVLDRAGDLLVYLSAGVDNLENLQHVDVLEQNIVGDYPGYQKTVLNACLKVEANLIDQADLFYTLFELLHQSFTFGVH